MIPNAGCHFSVHMNFSSNSKNKQIFPNWKDEIIVDYLPI